MTLRQLLPLLCAAVFGAGTARAYKELPPPPDLVLPAARNPAESLASIRVAPDLEVELVASEPLVMDPIDLAFGPDGRMWVVEMADYPKGLDGHGRPGGRIRVLESTRRDGRFDKSTLFASDLRHPTSVMPWRNGVLVTAIPDLLFLEDTDGDGRADRRTPVFTGIAEGNPQHLVNGLQWSMEGWLHMANGDSGGRLVSVKTGQVTDVGRRDFRIQPDAGRLEFLAGQAQAGRSRDDWENWFGCNNSNPFWHYALDDRYLRRNPHLAPPGATVSISAIPGAAPVFPASRTIARFNDPHGHNHFTSACGIMVYRDDALGAGYAGSLFVCEPVHNLVSRQVLRPAGATFQSERAPTEQSSEFLASSDNWSRFTAVRAGPDGALYVADMYRLVIEHPQWIPEAWQKRIGNVRAGEEQGRIYRVRRKGAALRPVPALERAAPRELAAALESPSGIVRDLAQQQLTWRGGDGARGELARLAREAALPAARAQALWTLETTGMLTADVVATALGDPHPGVRRQAVRLTERFANAEPGLLSALVGLATDADAAVRQQVAGTLGEWRDRRAGEALAGILQRDSDRFIRATAMSSALPHAETLLAELRRAGRVDDPLVIEIAAVTENARTLAAALEAVSTPRPGADATARFDAFAHLLDWLQRSNKPLAQWQASADPAVAAALAASDAVFEEARRTAVDVGAPAALRVAAIRLVGRGRARQSEDAKLLAGLLAPQSAVELQLAALAALGRLNRPQVGEWLLDGWNGYGPTVRPAVLQLVISRPAWAQVLLDRVEQNREMRAQIDAATQLALTQHATARLAQRAAEVFKASLDPDRERTIGRYAAALEKLAGDAARGAERFQQVCSACHRFGNAVAGRSIGPDLASVKDRSAAYLLTHILDPNRAVEDRYLLYTAATQDGRALAGMLTGEASSSVTLTTLDGERQEILRSDLRSLLSTRRSIMPDGLEAALDEQAMADLIAFLAAR